MTYKVLIVDDSKLARMAVVKALKSCYPDGDVRGGRQRRRMH